MSDSAGKTLRELRDIPVERLRHVGEKRTAQLAEVGITSVFDLLWWFPRRYIDRSQFSTLAALTVGDEATFFGQVTKIRAQRTKQGSTMVRADIVDGEATLGVTFFNQPWRERQLVAGTQALFFGKVSEFRGAFQLTNPVVDVVASPDGTERDPTRVGRIVAIYPTVNGLTSWDLGGFIDESLRRSGKLVDPVEGAIRAQANLLERSRAVEFIHRPPTLEDAEAARRRLAFDELMRLQVVIALRRELRARHALGVAHPVAPADLEVTPGSGGDDASSLVARFLSAHPYSLTNAQRRVLGEIFVDLAAPTPMHRLLQGDVGSGKTLVALTAMLGVASGGRQSILLAPTELLAEQHAAALRDQVRGLTVADAGALGGQRELRVALLTGRRSAKERRELIAELAAGSIDVVVATHAILSEDVSFRSLGLMVIDEQQRFGVAQRARYRDEGRQRSREGRDPDILVMSATPIPRTSAMVLFGDLDQSILDELPAGRQPITTTWLRDEADEDVAWRRVRDEVATGRRAYVVCPLVEGSEKIRATSAVEERTRLATGPLAGLSVGLVHGQMSAEERSRVMEEFRSGEIQVLVATVVIEVGVDVPEASVMVIEDAGRFGLAQLHQLRGRIGRGGEPGYCYLLGAASTPEGDARLSVLERETDGFALAEADLAIRGEGTLRGERQRGRSDLVLASLSEDRDLLEIAIDAAARAVAEDGARDWAEEISLFIEPDEADALFRS